MMKHIHKLTALLAVLTLLVSLWAPMAVSAQVAQPKELLYFGRSILAKMDNGEALCYAYDKLVEGIRNHDETVDISHPTYKLDWDEASTVADLARADHPAFFYLSYVAVGGGSYATYFAPSYDAELLPYIDLVNHRVEVLTQGLEGKSDYEKSLILHDRVCDTVKYNLNSQHSQNVFSSLALGESVCAGYARAYQLLLQAVGIPAYYVVGTADNGLMIGGHGWNLVQLDGEWYYSDVTWDDQNDNGGHVYYTYLNVTYDQIAVDHFADEYEEYLPRSTATANNFFVKNGLILTKDTEVDILQLAKQLPSLPALQFYCPDGNAREMASRAFDIAFELGYAMAGNDFSIDGLSILGNVLVLDLFILHEHTYEISTIPACERAPGTVTAHCTTCGYTDKVGTNPVGHEMVWTRDDTQHLFACIHCGGVAQHGAHNMENGVCTDCGYEKQVAVNYGDLNGDGAINNRDMALLQQYINKWNVSIDLAAADVNNDGAVNNRDLALLQQYINKWDVTLG